MPESPLVIYDGYCHLCDGAIRFILDKESGEHLLFTPNHSARAQAVFKKFRMEENCMETIILVQSEQVFKKSDAAIEIARYLKNPWRLFQYARIIPKPLRDWMYGVISRNRYKLFGKKNTCELPNDKNSDRFIGV